MSQFAYGRLTLSSACKIKSDKRARRSSRVKLSLPVLVQGKAPFAEPFRELTRTLSLSAHGGLLALVANVQNEQRILVENKHTHKEQECRIVYVGPPQNGKRLVGVEFTHAATDFWKINFPQTTSA